MTTPRPRTIRAQGSSLAGRLIALILIPVGALGVFSVQRISEANRKADEAAALSETVELQQAVADVYSPAQVERIALEGLARIDELGIPRELVAVVTGIDFESIGGSSRLALDGPLDALVNQFGEGQVVDGQSLADALGPIRHQIETVRASSRDRTATSTEIGGAFESLETVLDRVLENARARPRPTLVGGEARLQLDTLSNVLVSAGDTSRAIIRTVMYQTPEDRQESDELSLIHATHLEVHRTTLEPTLRGPLDRLLDVFEALPELPFAPVQSTETALANPDLIASLKDSVNGHLDYLEALQDYSAGFYAEVVATTESAAADAQREAWNTTLVLGSTVLGTLIVMAFVLWSTLSPVRALTRRAEEIGAGDLDHGDLPVRGPRDLRTLVRTTNDMVATLNQMQRELALLAAGEIADASAEQLPGPIGITMRESVNRLAQVTQQLQTSEEFASAVVNEAADAIWTVDDDGAIRTANAAAARLCGIDATDQIGTIIDATLATTDGETSIVRADSSEIRVLVVSSIVDVGGERITIVIAHDISERARFEEQLEFQANHDPLTGLPNRYALHHQLRERLHGPTGATVLFVDLDGFKNVNDTQGHAVGDQVLSEVARVLERAVDDNDFVGRLGGDEFVILAEPRPTRDETLAFGRRIIDAVERPIRVGTSVFTLSASIGVTVAAPDATALDAIRQADNAVYQAKRRGRGRVEFYDPTTQHRVEHEAELELALRNAIRNDELILHLQPVIDLRTDEIVGAEALVRWDRPGVGLIPPNDFIPIAERSSLIFDVERWVLRRSCSLLVDWRRRDPACATRLAVNISGRHLIDGDLVGDVERTLCATGADPSLLELELTETQLLEDVSRATDVLEQIRALGITIAVDDFGTGYSSLTYLRHLPVDTVKLDRSFVARSTEHGFDSTVIDALLTISRSMRLSVVAEGVETAAQLAHLRARGCDRAQGFLLSYPLPIDEAERFIFSSTALVADAG